MDKEIQSQLYDIHKRYGRLRIGGTDVDVIVSQIPHTQKWKVRITEPESLAGKTYIYNHEPRLFDMKPDKQYLRKILEGKRREHQYHNRAVKLIQEHQRKKGSKAYDLIVKLKKRAKALRLARHLRKEHPSTTGKMLVYDAAPRRWKLAMTQAVKRKAHVQNPKEIVKNIWKRLSPKAKDIIRRDEAAGKRFVYDLPDPDDRATHGTGTLRMVKPFKLTEVQVNISPKDYIAALRSGLFSKMKREDGTTALVSRCKSASKNCNIFVDKY